MESRITKLGVVAGQKGSGKTFKTMEWARKVLAGIPERGILGRKTLIMDINNEYEDIELLDSNPNHIRGFAAQKNLEIRRICSLNLKTGDNYSLDEYGQILHNALRNFRGGLTILEDLSSYTADSMKNDLVGSLCTNRHKNNDLIIHYQSLGRLTPKVLGNLDYIRLHKTSDSIEDQKDKFKDKYEILKIAELLIDNQYDSGNIRFCLYVEISGVRKITACQPFPITAEMKLSAVNSYLNEKSTIVKKMLSHTDNNGKKLYNHETARQAACTALLKKYF